MNDEDKQALEDRLYQAIVLDYEGRGEAWTTDDSGDTLARAAAEVAMREIAGLLPTEPLAHDWYHDGVMSGDQYSGYNRLCRTCRFREKILDGSPCLGDSSLHRAALNEGVAQGQIGERERLRRHLGLQ